MVLFVFNIEFPFIFAPENMWTDLCMIATTVKNAKASEYIPPH